MKILSVVGARPNFIKVAPLHRIFSEKNESIQSIIVHTGQHFDEKMSQVFFEQLSLPIPDYFLGVGHGTPTEVSAKIMLAFEPVLIKERPDLVIVVGDVTSTLACALVANKLDIQLAHVEAGLRSFDRSMPEEINRILTDQLSDFLFTTECVAKKNLIKENIPEEKIFFVGNCMIDSLVYYQNETSGLEKLKELGIEPGKYMMMTMHRPSNVDSALGLDRILNILKRMLPIGMKVIFPLHPRTKQKLIEFGLFDSLIDLPHLILTEPLGYLEFINLLRFSLLAITDSGGIQEETTYLGIPCITLRKSTERPITVDEGSNTLIPDLDVDRIMDLLDQIVAKKYKKSQVPEMWDGRAAVRIYEILLHGLNSKTYANH
ncbi:MAG: UDP-N-acetylglucosamine 2-epimerase (non-hydrolyzing) [Saprospiraceae bacterium]|nr:UDP-N-acetylglucosamine 2-epimerase (non-hydrolyzing) [Saprospiraceae bacterium]